MDIVVHKVKTFSNSSSGLLEKDINMWLVNIDPEIKIIDIKYTANDKVFSVLIHYTW